MVTYKKLKYNGNDVVQVRSAQKDAAGAQIDTTYVKKSTVSVPSTVPTASWGGTATIGSVDGKDFKIKMMGNPDTDAKVAQTLKTDNYDRPLLMSDQIISTTTVDVTGEARRNNSIYANTSTGKITSTLIDATQVGGMTKTYTISATDYKTIAQVSSASQYWTVNGGNSHIRLKIEYSSLSSPASTATTTKLGEWIVDVAFSGTVADVFAVSENGNAGNANGVLRYFGAFSPKTTSYAPKICVQNYSATSTYVKITILSCTPGWELPASFGGNPGTTNYTRYAYEMGRYNYTWSSNKISANITGSCDGAAGSSWDSLRNDRYLFGESAVAGSIMAKASDGRMYKLRNGLNKEFILPLHLGRCTGTFTYDESVSPPTLTNYAQIMWNMKGMAYTELTNASMQTGAFTVPTLTSNDFGKTLYITGTLSNGNFKPDGNIVLAMVNGKTNIPIGRIDRANVALNTVPTQFTITGYSQTAYTLDTNGKLTYVDGKEIKDTTYTLAGLGGVPTSRKINGYDLTTDRTLNGADVALTGYTKPSSTSAVAATDTINGAIGKLETALDGKMKRGSYERIEGTSATHKNLNNYYTAGFYNIKGQYVDNCPLTGDMDYYLLVMPWNKDNWCVQICVSGNYTTSNYQRVWVRSATNNTATAWTSWSRLANISDLSSYAPLASPALTGTPTAPTATAGTNTTQIATTEFVKTAIDALPEPMLFKGTLGTGGTITSLPTAAAANEGYVYKVITDGTYASQAAKIGDTFISTGSEWVLIPSGDEPSGTVTNVATGVGLTGGPITSSGTIKAKLKSETNATYDSETITNTSGRQYAVVPDKTNGYLSVNVPWTDLYVNQQRLAPNNTDRPILLSADGTIHSGDYTGPTAIDNSIYANTSTGTLTASHFYNSTTSSSLDFIVGSKLYLSEVD